MHICIAAAAAKSLQLCLTLRPHRWQPARLPRPWDSPGKNTGVDCHFLLQCMKVKSESEVTQLCPSDPMDCSLLGSSIHGIFQARVLAWGAIAFSTYMHYVYVLYEWYAASLHQIYLLLWVLAKKLDSRWAAGTSREPVHPVVSCLWRVSRSFPASVHTQMTPRPACLHGAGSASWSPAPRYTWRRTSPICLKVSGSVSFLLPVLLPSSDFWLLENHSRLPLP